jgi:uncharacterized coiled-coil DUF342 family protein
MSKELNFNSEEINKSLEELESLIKDNQVPLEKENVDVSPILNIFKEIDKIQKEIQDLSNQLYASSKKTDDT